MNNSNIKRTGGKWEYKAELEGINKFEPYIAIYSNIAGRTLIANVNTFAYLADNMKYEAEKNAEFICKAVNEYDALEASHSSLLSSLKDLLDRLDKTGLIINFPSVVNQCKEAILAAEKL